MGLKSPSPNQEVCSLLGPCLAHPWPNSSNLCCYASSCPMILHARSSQQLAGFCPSPRPTSQQPCVVRLDLSRPKNLKPSFSWASPHPFVPSFLPKSQQLLLLGSLDHTAQRLATLL
ncbi:hypothetical protein ACFX19_007509 [Malus domestica]